MRTRGSTAPSSAGSGRCWSLTRRAPPTWASMTTTTVSRSAPTSRRAEVAFHRAAVAEMERFPADDLSPDRALDRDLVIHEARLAIHQLSERRAWAGSSRGPSTSATPCSPLHARLRPAGGTAGLIAARLEAAPAYLAQTRTRVDRAGAPVGRDRHRRQRFAAGVPGDDRGRSPLRARGPGAAGPRRDRGRSAARRPGRARRLAAQRRPAPCQGSMADRSRRLRGAGSALRALDADLGRDPRRRRAACWPRRRRPRRISVEIDPTLSPAEVTDLVKENHPATFPRRSRNTARPWIGRATSSSSTIWPRCRTRIGCG